VSLPLRVAILSVSSVFSRLVGKALDTDPDVSVVYAGAIGVSPEWDRPPHVAIVDFDAERAADVSIALTRLGELRVPALAMAPSVTPAITVRLERDGFTAVRRRPDLQHLTSAGGIDPLIKLLRAVAASPAPARTGAATLQARPQVSTPPRPPAPPFAPPGNPPPLLCVIGASTGGPQAVRRVLQDLPPDPRWAVAIVQHIGAGFAEGFARWISEATGHVAHVAHDGEPLAGGVTVVAPGDMHLLVRRRRYALDDGPKRVFQRPSADTLFESAAEAYGAATVGILLTGMGRDGGEGARRIVDAGGITLVQNEETSVVYGMPKAAVDAGGASEVLPLDAIGERANALLNRLAVS